MATNNSTNFPILDEDGMTSDSAASLATQQSVKAYVDTNINRKNLIIGGNFSTNPWQRGTTFTGIAHNTYAADRFKYLAVGAVVSDALKTTDAPTVAEAGIFSQNCFEVDITTADASIAAGDFCMVQSIMEGYDFSQIAQRAFTISFWVKAKTIGTYCVSFINSAADRSYVAEYSIAIADTWEKKTVTISASPSAGTWDYANGIGIKINFVMACGSTFQTTAGSWQTGNFFATSNQVNGIASTSDYLRLGLIQVEAGGAATPFEVRHQETELALCQRYYYKSFLQGVAPANMVGYAGAVGYRTALAGVQSTTVNFFYPVTMRAYPATLTYNPTSNNTTWYNLSLAADSGAASGVVAGSNSITMNNAQVAGDLATHSIAIHFTSEAEF